MKKEKATPLETLAMLIAEGKEHSQQARYSNAIDSFTRALALFPRSEEASFELGKNLLLQKKYAQSIEALKNAHEVNPCNVYTSLLLGKAYSKLDNSKAALEAFKEVLALASKDEAIRGDSAREIMQLYYDNEEYDLALKQWDVLGHPTFDYTLTLLVGKIYQRTGAYEKALELLESGCKNSQGNTAIFNEFRYEKACAHFHQKNYQHAKKILQNILQENPHHENACVLLGKTYIALKEYDAGLKACRDALERPLQQNIIAEILSTMAGACIEKYAQAQTATASSLPKKKIPMQEIRNGTSRKQDTPVVPLPQVQGKELLPFLDRICRFNWHLDRSEEFFAQSQYKEATNEILACIRIDPSQPKAYILLCRILQKEKRYAEARAECDKALRLCHKQKPLEAEIYFEQGNILKAQEDYVQAIKEFNAIVVMLCPEYADPRYCPGDPLQKVKTVKISNGPLSPEEQPNFTKINAPQEIIDAYRAAIHRIGKDNALGNFSIALQKAEALQPKLSNTEAVLQNALLNEIEIARQKTELISHVRDLSIMLTNRCNIACRMCPQDKTQVRELSEGVLEDITALFPYLENISWLGGEVFLYKGFARILKKTAHYRFNQNIITNGLLIDEEAAEALVMNNIEVIYSIDAVTKETYEYIRKGACYEALMQSIHTLNKYASSGNKQFRKTINVVIMHSNYDTLETFVPFAKKHGFTKINYSMIVNSKNTDEDIFVLHYDEAKMRHITRSLEKIKVLCANEGIDFYTNIADTMARMGGQRGISEYVRSGSDALAPRFCVAPWKKVHIDNYGNVFPNAHCLCDTVIGNLYLNTFSEIWNAPSMREYRKALVQGKIDQVCNLKDIYGRIPYEQLAEA